MISSNQSQKYQPLANEAPASSGQMIDAYALLRTLRIHMWMLIALAFAGTVIGFLIGESLTPKYTAVAEILIEQDDRGFAQDNDNVRDQLADDFLETEVKFLTSKTYMHQIVQQTSVFDEVARNRENPEQDTSFFSIGPIINQAFAWLDSNTGQTSSTIDPDLSVFEERVELFADSYNVKVAGGSRVIEISYVSDDPKEAAEVVNLAARIHIEKKLSIRQDNNVESTSWIEGRVKALREELNEAERDIEKFRAAYSLETDNFNASTEELSGFVLELIRLKAELSQDETKLASINNLRSKNQNVLNLPEIAQSQNIGDLQVELREIQQRKAELANVFGKKHPEMIAVAAEESTVVVRIEQEVDRIIQNLQDSVDIKRGQKAALEVEIASSRDRQLSQSDFEVQLREKERGAEAIRQLYEGFLQRSRELNEEKLAINSNIVQLSEALPPALSSTPSSKLTALIGLCLAFFGGSVTAILREQQDQRIRSEQHILNHLGLKAIGVIPEIKDLRRNQGSDSSRRSKKVPFGKKSERERLYEYMLEKPMSFYTDSIRSVLLSLKSDIKTKGTKVVVTTSTLPNEGKTTFAVSLAALAANSGLRTLIIDLDLRHPSVREELRVQAKPSLTEYVRGMREIKDTIWTHPKLSKLDAVMSTNPEPNPMTVLESEELMALLDEARETYDLVIIDSAPLFAVSEARIVAGLGDSVLFVVRWGATDCDTARNGLYRLEESGVDNVIGAVLTQVDFKKHHLHQYRDAGHYYKEYKNYYVD